MFDRRIRLGLLGLRCLLVVSTLFLRAGGQDWVTATYLALTASTATGANFEALSRAYQFGAVAIQFAAGRDERRGPRASPAPGSWQAADRQARAVDRLAVVATRSGLARLLLNLRRRAEPSES